MSGDICGFTSGVGVLLVDSTQMEREAEESATILQCTGQPPTPRRDPAPNVNNAEVGKPRAK